MLNLDPPDARCNSIVVQEACVPDQSQLVVITDNIDGFTSNPLIVDSSQHLQNDIHSSISHEESGEPELNVILIVVPKT